ncbi:MAG: ATP-binding protein [Tannerella sp.]|jgi:energy-coupling factor transporter ATP-binding protein EcfA2|nr:ATP-binding protein [Tannerella sp.]
MATLKVSNFGPLRELEWEIKDYNIFIGPQAAGKSTVAKLAYYFLSVKERMIGHLVGITAYPLDVEEKMQSVTKELKRMFVELFGPTKRMSTFRISYSYGEKISIDITLAEGYPEVHFSDELSRAFRNILRKQSDGRDERPKMRGRVYSELFSSLEKELNAVFREENRTAIYVPAGRGFLTCFVPNLVSKLPESTLTLFTNRMALTQPLFNQSFEEIIRDRKNLSSSKIDEESLAHVTALARKILKGEYRYGPEESRLYYKETEYVTLPYASSGQQEALWIVQLIFSLILDNTQTTLLIEEPEAHLFPETQADMVRLISLFAGLNGNRVILTTHSPYILSTANYLLYAAKTGAKYPEKVNETVPSCYWIDYDRMGVWYVDKGGIESLMEDDIRQIHVERIDEISEKLNKAFDDLLRMDDDEI